MPALDGKVAVITGAATGLGAVIAEVYAGAGAKVVLGDIRADEVAATAAKLRTNGAAALAQKCDVTDSDSVRELMLRAEAEYGGIDIVTANAGILGRGHKKSIVDVTEDELRQILEVNFIGTWFTFQHGIAALKRNGGGALSVTASTSASRGTAKAPAYAASKGAIVALMRAASVDLWPEIRVNSVSPGAMATELGVHTAQELGLDVSEIMAQAHNVVAADPIESALAHLYLVSPASAGVTGQDIHVDHGATMQHP